MKALIGLVFLLAACASSPDLPRLLENSVGIFGTEDYNRCTVFKTGTKEFLTAKHCVVGLSPNEMAVPFYIKWKEEKARINKFVTGEGQDWANIYIEKDIDGMSALPLDCISSPYLSQQVASLSSHPAAISSVYLEGEVASLGGWERGNWDADFLVTLRADAGTSGSPVIDRDTGKVIGILVEIFFGGNPPYNDFFFLSGVESIKHVSKCKENIQQ